MLCTGVEQLRSIMSAAGKLQALGPLDENDADDEDEDEEEEEGEEEEEDAASKALTQAMAGVRVT